MYHCYCNLKVLKEVGQGQNHVKHSISYKECIVYEGKGKGTRYLTSEVPLLSREYSPRKPTERSFYPPLSISAPF